jgi:hypothetical protein
MQRIFSVLLLSIALSSCHFFHGKRIHGDGNVVKQDRSATGFNSVDVSGGLKLIIRQDSAYSVQVEVDNNLQQYIEVYTEGDVLYVHQQNNTSLEATGSIKVYVSSPVYTKLMASGACSIKADNKLSSNSALVIDLSGASMADLDIKYPSTKLTLTGASNADVRGESKDLTASGSGACEFRLFGLMTENADIDVSGASNADVFASVKLDVEASGASHVNYKGAANFVANTSGASNVKKVD